MENPNSWDDLTKLIDAEVRAHEEALAQGVPGCSLPQRIRNKLELMRRSNIVATNAFTRIAQAHHVSATIPCTVEGWEALADSIESFMHNYDKMMAEQWP